MEAEALYSYYLNHPVISTDTRNIPVDSLFFALKGERFNGNQFAKQALDKGACYAVVDEPQAGDDERYLYVPDVLTALQDLARQHRGQLGIPVVGIHGTNGKTPTTEMHKVVFEHRCNTNAITRNSKHNITEHTT